MYGIQIMQQQDYLVTARSVNLIKELRQYCWDVDKNGVKLNKPAGGFDHAIDAVRYHEMMAVGKRKRKATFGWGKKKPLPETEEVVHQIDPDYDVSDLI